MNTTRRAPASRAATSMFSVPPTLTERIAARDAWIGSAAAACTTMSAPSTSRRTSRTSRTSPRTSSTAASSSASSSGTTSSVRTECPSASSRRARWRPRKPAPPEIAHNIARTLTGGNRPRSCKPAAMRRTLCLAVFLLVGLPPATASARISPQAAGLQVALRAYGTYLGPIDGIAGPATVRGVRRFQQRVGLHVDGRVGRATRRAFGPLGRPLFGTRTLRRGEFGWDGSVLQVLLARRGELVPIDGFFDAQTERALRHFQRSRNLAADGIAGNRTLTAFTRRSPQAVRPVLVRATTPAAQVRTLLDYWAAHYSVDRKLVRAVAWMESGFQTNLTSAAGA